MRGRSGRLSDWVVRHPVWWGVGAGVVLVLLGLAFDLAPIVVIAAGAAVGVLNILHARRRGYCPLPADRELPVLDERTSEATLGFDDDGLPT